MHAFQESEKFLEENKTKDGVKVTESGLQYKVLKEGKGPGPGPEDFVKVNYRGTFIDGSEFDSSYSKGEPARVQTDGVIKGWTEALQMMKTGSKWQLFVPPELAYGRVGLGQRIPPNKVLVFDIVLLAVEKKDEAGQSAGAQTAQKQLVRKMSITGQIAKGAHGYIIRGKQPQMMWTILNAEPNTAFWQGSTGSCPFTTGPSSGSGEEGGKICFAKAPRQGVVAPLSVTSEARRDNFRHFRSL